MMDCDIFIGLLIDNDVHEEGPDNLSTNVKFVSDDNLKEKDIPNAEKRTNPSTTLTIESNKPRTLEIARLSQTVIVNSALDISNERQATIDRKVVTHGSSIPFHAKPPRYQDYTEQEKRLATFSMPKWSVDNKPNIFLFAECGFFFTGNYDLVRCYQCGIGLKDWIKEDDVLTEHVKHSSSCDFLIKRFGKSKIDKTLALSSDYKNETAPVDPPLPYKILSPKYQTMEARLASFISFPSSIYLPAQQLAVAGLYYTGKGDLCRCFACDGGLKDWSSGDDPIKKHATYFPKCSYITKLIGSEYSTFQQQSRRSSEPMRAKGGITTTQLIQSSSNPLTIADSKEREYYKRVLRKNTKEFVEDLSPTALLDEFSRSEFLTWPEIRDIQELSLTSDKNRKILEKVMTKGERGYKTFKDCLQKCNQGRLVEILEREEDLVLDESK